MLNQECKQSDLNAVIENLPLRYRDYGFNGMVENNENKNAIEKCKGYSKFGKIDNKTSIIFSGNIGTGKTRLAVAVLRNMKPVRIKSIAQQFDGKLRSHKSIYVLADMFYNKMNESASQGGKENVIKNFLSYDVVLFDDLSFENFSTAKQENLYLFINEIYLQEKKIFITMNFPMNRLQEIEPRVADRLIETATLIKFNGQSFRN